MEGKKFSSSKKIVIYVHDLLAATSRTPSATSSPPRARRTRTRLHVGGVRASHQRRAGRRLGQPGQPHRQPDRQELRRDPGRGALTPEDEGGPRRHRGGLRRGGDLIGRHRQKQAIGEAMRAVAEVTGHVSDTEPWKIKEDPERLGTVPHVMAQCVADLNVLLSPFLPFSANEVDKASAGHGRADAAHRGGHRPTTPRGPT